MEWRWSNYKKDTKTKFLGVSLVCNLSGIVVRIAQYDLINKQGRVFDAHLCKNYLMVSWGWNMPEGGVYPHQYLFGNLQTILNEWFDMNRENRILEGLKNDNSRNQEAGSLRSI